MADMEYEIIALLRDLEKTKRQNAERFLSQALNDSKKDYYISSMRENCVADGVSEAIFRIEMFLYELDHGERPRTCPT